MANQSDGSIRIDTKLDTEGFKKGSEKLRGAIKSLTDTSDKLAKSYASIGKDAASLLIKTAKMQTQAKAGFKDQKALDDYKTKLAALVLQYGELQKKLEAFGKSEFTDNAAFRDAVKEISVAANAKDAERLERAQKAMRDLYAQGGKYKGVDTQEYADAAENIEIAGDALERLNNLKQESAETTDDNNRWRDFSNVMNLVGQSAVKMAGSFKRVGWSSISWGLGKAADATKRLYGWIKNAASGVNTLLGRFRLFSSQGGQTGNMIRNISKALTSLRTLLIARVKNTFLSSLFNAVKSDFQELARYSNEFNNAMSNMKNAATGLAGNLSVSFGNLINALEPIITRIINMMSTAITYINTFFGLLTGKSSITVAKQGADSYAAGLSSAASAAGDAADAQADLNRELYSFDEINKMSSNNASSGGSGGGGGGGGGASDLFETMPISGILPESLLDFANKIKDAISNSDWEGVGEILAEGLNSVVSKVDEWNTKTFGPKAKTWASNIASLLNGLFSGWDASATGNTLGGLLNSVLDSINTFITTFKWDQAGTKIASCINGLFSGVDWNLFGTTIGNAITSFWTAVDNWATSTNWKSYGSQIATGLNALIDTKPLTTKVNAIKDVLNGIFTFLGSFVETFDWDAFKDDLSGAIGAALDIDIGAAITNIGTIIINFIHSLAQAVTDNKDKFVEFGQKIGDALAGLNWGQLLQDVGTIIIDGLGGILKGLVTSDSGGVVIAIAGVLGTYKLSSGVKSLLTTFGGTFGEGVLGSIAEALTGSSGILVAATAVVAGIITTELIKWQEQISNYYGEFDSKADALKQKWERARQDLENSLANLDYQDAQTDTLLDQYDDILNQAGDNLDPEDWAKLRAIVKELITMYPELNEYVDEQSGLFSVNTDEIRANTDALLEAARTKAYMDALQASLEVYVESEMNYKAALEKTASTQEMYNALLERQELLYELANAAQRGDQEAIEELSASLESNSTKLSENADLLEELGITVDDLSVKTGDAAAAEGDYMAAAEKTGTAVQAVNDAHQDSSDLLDELSTSVSDARSEYESLSEEVANASNGTKTFNTQVKDLTLELMKQATSVDEAKQALSNFAEVSGFSDTQTASLLAAFDGYIEKGYSIAEATELISQNIDSIGASAENAATSVDGSMDGMVNGIKNAATNAGTQAKNVSTKIYNGLSSKTSNTKTLGTTYLTNLNTGLTDATKLKQISTSGKGAADKAWYGMASYKGEATEKISRSLLGSMSTGLKDSSKLAALSKSAVSVADKAWYGMASWKGASTEGIGKSLVGNINTGVRNNEKVNTLSKSAVALADKIWYGMAAYKGSVTERIGQDLVIGLGNGINSKVGSLQTIVTRLAEGAISTIKQKLGVASPSKVFRQIGVYSVQGLEVGIDDEKPKALKTVAGMAKDIVNTAGDGTSNLFEYSSDVLINGLDLVASKLSNIANIFVNIGNLLDRIGSHHIPDLVSGATMPTRAAIGGTLSAASIGSGSSQELSGSGTQMREELDLLREQNDLLRELIRVSGNSGTSAGEIAGMLHRANRRAGKTIVPVGV